MSATHTPGPWGASCSPFDMAVTAIIDGKSIDLMGARGDLGDQAEVNITLAAAAPDLLDALQYMVDVGCEFYDMDMGENGSAALQQAYAALAKAKGEQP